MTVRLRLALTVFLSGLASAALVIAMVALAFVRFEAEATFQRADAFVERVVGMHGNLIEQQRRDPAGLAAFLASLVLYEPETRLYLLDPQGRVLASSDARRSTVQQVPVDALRRAADAATAAPRPAYLTGEDPERPGLITVVTARALRPAAISPGAPVAGYLYLVCTKGEGPAARFEVFSSSFAMPALVAVAGVMLLATLLAAWIIVAVTRPLRVLSDEVDAAAREGFAGAHAGTALAPVAPPPPGGDEFVRLRGGFHALLATLRRQWDALRRLDHFRRESVSNLSHDLRSPLTATVACLETLDQRWAHEAARGEDRRLIEVALRNTRNAAALVRSLGDLALLDEPEYRLQRVRLDLDEVIDDLAQRFTERAARQGVRLACEHAGPGPTAAEVDVELLERALANLLDNALKHTPAGGEVLLATSREGREVAICVADQGPGIAEADIPRLFDRHWRGPEAAAPASSEQGRGLGLAIVKRIVELHRGQVQVGSQQGVGTRISILLPAA